MMSSVDCVAISLPASCLLNTLNIQKQKANFPFDISNSIADLESVMYLLEFVLCCTHQQVWTKHQKCLELNL